MRRAALGAIMLAVVGCGGSSAPPQPPPDEALARTARAGRLALDLERPAEAARLYGQALTRARQRDDAEAIADAGIGLAAAELDRGRPREALSTARTVRGELVRRNAPVPAALSLAEAVALHRLGEAGAADRAAAQAAQAAGDDLPAFRRATFLRGLIAAGRGDAAGLAEARTALGAPEQPAYRADARELEALAALAAGGAEAARQAAAAAAADRREALDYRGLGRALALQAEAARRVGDRAGAADLWLRAGRGAAARDETATARRWLAAAEADARRARAAEVAAAARAELRALAAGERDR